MQVSRYMAPFDQQNLISATDDTSTETLSTKSPRPMYWSSSRRKLSRVIGNHERGLYMGVQQTFGGVARVVAPIWAGFAFDRLGLGVPFYTSAVVVLATISLGLGLDQYARRE